MPTPTRRSSASRYFLESQRAVSTATPAYLLRRDLDDEVEFATVMIFDSLDHVRAFAGDDYETAYVPPAARAVLTRFDEKSAHYTTLLTPEQTR
jgi:hypothetical protein